MEDFIMYEEIFNQIRSAANKRNLKDSTIHAYCTSVAHFLNHTAKDIDALTTDDVDIFLTEKKLSGISPETYNHYHSGIRFFYKKILKKNWDDDDIPRMKRDRKLPTVLTKTEISAILDATPNLKHKAMIATMYSGGLRVSEVTHLHYDDISRTKKTIHIRDGKSRSDRYTLLADRTLEILTEYWFQCGRPRGILFPSSWTGDYLTKDSVIQFFRESAKRAGIQKHVSTHCLRHSFASHLFESGCDVKYIHPFRGTGYQSPCQTGTRRRPDHPRHPDRDLRPPHPHRHLHHVERQPDAPGIGTVALSGLPGARSGRPFRRNDHAPRRNALDRTGIPPHVRPHRYRSRPVAAVLQTRFRTGSRHHVRQHGQPDGAELCQRLDPRRSSGRGVRDGLSRMHVPAGHHHSDSDHVLYLAVAGRQTALRSEEAQRTEPGTQRPTSGSSATRRISPSKLGVKIPPPTPSAISRSVQKRPPSNSPLGTTGPSYTVL